MKCMQIDGISWPGLLIFRDNGRHAVGAPHLRALAYICEENYKKMVAKNDILNVSIPAPPKRPTLYDDIVGNNAPFVLRAEVNIKENGEVWLVPNYSKKSELIVLTVDFWTAEDCVSHFLGDMDRLATVMDPTSSKTYHLLRLSRDSGVVSINKGWHGKIPNGKIIDYRLFYYENGLVAIK